MARSLEKEPGTQRVKILCGLLQRPARLQPCHHSVNKLFGGRIGRRTSRIGKIEAIAHDHAEEGWWRDTENLHRFSLGNDGGAGGDRLAAHLRLPEGVAGDHAGDVAAVHILRFDQAPLDWSDPKRAEEISADFEPAHTVRVAGSAHLCVIGAPRKDAGEGVMVLPYLLPHGHGEIGELSVGDSESAIASDDSQLRQFAGFRDGEGAQAHRVEKLEYCGVGADAERKRGENDEGKARALDENAQGAAHIVPEALKPERSILCRDALKHRRRAAEAPARITLRRFAAHSLGKVVVNAHGNVFPQLRFNLLLHACAPSQRQNPSEECHRSPHAKRRTASTPLTTCAQFFSQQASCSRPARVSAYHLALRP